VPELYKVRDIPGTCLFPSRSFYFSVTKNLADDIVFFDFAVIKIDLRNRPEASGLSAAPGAAFCRAASRIGFNPARPQGA
jgi:hypothetical protein